MTSAAALPRLTPALRAFIVRQTAALQAAYDDAFADGAAQACEELDDEEFECPDTDELLARDSDARRRILAFYGRAITKQAGELAVLVANGMSADLIAARIRDIERRIQQQIEGLVWTASERGYAVVTSRSGRGIDWILDDGAQHCGQCPGLAAGSPYASVNDLPALPGDGSTDCGSRCRCHLQAA